MNLHTPERGVSESFEDYKLRRKESHAAPRTRPLFQHQHTTDGNRPLFLGQHTADANRTKRRTIIGAIGVRQFKKVYRGVQV